MTFGKVPVFVVEKASCPGQTGEVTGLQVETNQPREPNKIFTVNPQT